MTDPDARLAETRRLSALLVGYAERAKADFAAAIAPYGLPVHLARALLMLEKPMPQFELAEGLSCDRSYVTGLVDGLEERGLVSRAPGSDRRVKILKLTPAGVALRAQLGSAAAENSLVMRLSDQDRATLEALLIRLAGEPEGEVDLSC